MPRLTPSKGVQRFTAAVPEEFTRWVQYELVNSVKWNPECMTMDPLGREFTFTDRFGTVRWKARFSSHPHCITFESEEPRIHIRKGFYISMGKGELILEGKTP